jgi:hypothetical protein
MHFKINKFKFKSFGEVAPIPKNQSELFVYAMCILIYSYTLTVLFPEFESTAII